MESHTKILLIDDDDVDRMSVIRAFKKIDSTMVFDEAPDDVVAVQFLQAGEYDCLLLDFRLGARDGLELLKRIHQHGLSAAPIVMLSGLDDERVMLECLKEGAQDYLLKSEITSNSLMRSVRYASERKRVAEELLYIAHHDSLTGLCNRSLYLSNVNHAMANAKRYGYSIAVCFIDLDHFKEVNDTLGHDAGDRLLKIMSGRVRDLVRGGDIVGRLGGDEFAILFNNIQNKNDIILIAEKILEIISLPVVLLDREIQVTPSIGVSIYTGGDETAEDMVRCADIAMYHAKKAGRNAFHFYSSEMLELAVRRSRLKTELIEALNREEFELYYQPQFDINSGAIKGVEALLRWNHPNRGQVSPAEFIPVAEETGLIVKIGEWVINQACQQLDIWTSMGLVPADDFTLSVNVSVLQLKRGNLVKIIQNEVRDRSFKSKQLVLELTESMLIEDINWCKLILEDITRLGVRVAIDDFGTGYASFRHMLGLPLSYLKIDKSFIDNITLQKKSLAIVTAIIAMAEALELQIVAEGVETQEQADQLLIKGCKLAQGYLFSKPIKADTVQLLFSETVY